MARKATKKPQRKVPLVRIGAIVAGALLLLFATQFGDEPQSSGSEEAGPAPEAGGENMLYNPGFEDGAAGWDWLSWSSGWAPFEISTDRKHSGDKAVYFPMRSEGETRTTIVWGAMQKVPVGPAFPECLEGWYMVDDWVRGAVKQYLQAVIISDLKTESGSDKQVRMMLTGMDEPPYNLTNARYYFCDEKRPLTPPLDTWVHFKCQPKKWFEEAWNVLPGPGAFVRVFFEARFDGRSRKANEVVAKTYFDDVYLGPATHGHCQ